MPLLHASPTCSTRPPQRTTIRDHATERSKLLPLTLHTPPNQCKHTTIRTIRAPSSQAYGPRDHALRRQPSLRLPRILNPRVHLHDHRSDMPPNAQCKLESLHTATKHTSLQNNNSLLRLLAQPCSNDSRTLLPGVRSTHPSPSRLPSSPPR